MFRLTVSGAPVSAFHAKHSSAPRTTLRVYKWGDTTGHFVAGAPWDRAWVAEARAPVAHGPTAVLESVTPVVCDAPPPTVDDLWEEEVVVSGSVIAGNTLSIAGNGSTLMEFVRKAGITLPPAVSDALTASSSALAQSQGAEPSTPDTRPAVPAQRPAFRGDPRPQRPPSARPPQSSRDPATHPGPRGSPREEPRPLNYVRSYAPRPEHTGPRPYVPRAGPGPAFRAPSHPQTAQRPQGPVHAGAGRPRFERHPTNPRPPSRGCLAVEE